MKTFIMEYKQWIDSACNSAKLEKNKIWSESIAVGSHEFIDVIREKLDYRVQSRKAIEKNGLFYLKEPDAFYISYFTAKNDSPNVEDTYSW